MLEDSPIPNSLKTVKKHGVNYRQYKGKVGTEMRGKYLGRDLRRFADTHNVRVKNITVGGCEGDAAAFDVGRGYAAGGPKIGETLNTSGIKRGNFTRYFVNKEKKIMSEFNFGFPERKIYVMHKDLEDFASLKKDANGETSMTDLRGITDDDEIVDLNYAEGNEINELVDGRIPERMASDFHNFKFDY